VGGIDILITDAVHGDRMPVSVKSVELGGDRLRVTKTQKPVVAY